MNRKRTVLLIIALAILVWFGTGAYLWWSSFGSIGVAITHFWATMASDWMVLLFINDLVVLILLSCIWTVKDARQRGWAGYKLWGWIAAIIALGSPALIAYLAFRPGRTRD